MNEKSQIDRIREELDEIDEKLIEMFQKRMKLIDRVAGVKSTGNFQITDESRERFIINRALSMSDNEYAEDIMLFMNSLIQISKKRQDKLIKKENRD